MLDPVAVGLKFGFLAVLYLFLLWVAWSAVRDLRRSRRPSEAVEAMPSDATGFHTASSGLGGGEDDDADPCLVVERAPGHEPGMSYEIGDGAVLGRGDVEIKLEDPFASSRHARLIKEGPVMVLEDLGSTNGTFLNGEPVDGPQPLHPGDVIRIGDSEFTFST